MNTTGRFRRRLAPLAIVVSLLLVGSCRKQTTIQTPPPVQVANSINALAQSVDAATSALIAARDAGKLPQADLNSAFRVITSIAATGKQLNAELRSTDTWEVQKTKMRQIIVASGVASISSSLPPNARAIMLVALTTFNAISAGVGGPIL
jgi:cell division FtsZ-interacting protein ZapD